MTSTEQRLSLHLAFDEWTESLSRALESRGFASLSAYADSWPEASLAELAADLGGPDASPTALEQRLIEEAEATGKMERCARSRLARDLRQELSERGERLTESLHAGRLSSAAIAHAISTIDNILSDLGSQVANNDRLGIQVGSEEELVFRTARLIIDTQLDQLDVAIRCIVADNAPEPSAPS